MSSNGIVTTVVGWAATAPREIQGGRVPYTSFRLATTPRHYDSGRGAWVEGRTEWLTVKVFRDTALNVAMSVQKGQPVIVYGKLKTEEWTGENGPRSGLVLEASALGHDLTRGRGSFVKVTRVPDASTGTAAEGADVAADPSEDAGDEVDPWAVDLEGSGEEMAAELSELTGDELDQEVGAGTP